MIEILDISTVLPFGKYKGYKMIQVIALNIKYATWFKNNVELQWSYELLVEYYKVVNPSIRTQIKKSLMKEYNCVRYYDLKLLLGKDKIEELVKQRLNENHSLLIE